MSRFTWQSHNIWNGIQSIIFFALLPVSILGFSESEDPKYDYISDIRTVAVDDDQTEMIESNLLKEQLIQNIPDYCHENEGSLSKFEIIARYPKSEDSAQLNDYLVFSFEYKCKKPL